MPRKLVGVIVIFLLGITCPLLQIISNANKPANGSLTVRNKITKHVSEELNVFIQSKEPLTKGRLHLSRPLNGCKSVEPVNTNNVYSTKDGVSPVNDFLLVEISDETVGDCGIEEKINNAKSAGYSGAIFYSLEAKDIPNDKTFFVAFVSREDGETLKQYVKLGYSLSFQRDIELTEKLYKYISAIAEAFLDFFVSSRYASAKESLLQCCYFVLQAIMALSPVLYLAWYLSNNRPPAYYATFSQSFAEEANFYEYYYSENNNTTPNNDGIISDDDDAEEKLQQYRELLEVQPHAQRQEIDASFRRISASYHPDKNMDLPYEERFKKAEHFKKLNQARIELLKEFET